MVRVNFKYGETFSLEQGSGYASHNGHTAEIVGPVTLKTPDEYRELYGESLVYVEFRDGWQTMAWESELTQL